MRKFLSKTMLLAALTALFLAATAAAASIGTGVVDADTLRVRTEPSTDASTITYLSDGTQVQVLEDLGDWYQISWNGYTGYVSAEFLLYTPAGTVTSNAPAVRDVTGRIGVLDSEGVYFRAGPSVADEVYDVMADGDEVVILTLADGWCQVDWEGQEGYIKADYLSVDGIPLVDPQGLITGDVVNLRSAPGTDSSVLSKIYGGSLVDIITLENGWYAVSHNGTSGYIREDYLRIYDESETAGSAIGGDIVETALSFLGTPYVYGGASARGFDCSGFTMYVFSLHGYSLPHSATSQWNNSGTYVERSDLQPGDLVLFCDPSRSNGKACSHVGIYIGNNEFVHASSGSSGKYVRTNSLSEDYYNGYYVGAKRVA